MLSKIRHYVPKDKLIEIYFAIFARLQKCALRIMSFAKKDAHTEPLFKEFKILKIVNQITLLNCLLIHDHSRNLLPNSYQNFFIPCEDLHTSETTNSAGGLIFVPFCNSTTYGRKSIKISAILQWNHLSEILEKNLLSLNRYNLKALLTSHFLDSYSSS